MKIFHKRRLYVEMGEIGFCCGIINKPQNFAKVKVCGDGEGMIFVAVSL